MQRRVKAPLTKGPAFCLCLLSRCCVLNNVHSFPPHSGLKENTLGLSFLGGWHILPPPLPSCQAGRVCRTLCEGRVGARRGLGPEGAAGPGEAALGARPETVVSPLLTWGLCASCGQSRAERRWQARHPHQVGPARLLSVSFGLGLLAWPVSDSWPRPRGSQASFRVMILKPSLKDSGRKWVSYLVSRK